MAEILIRETEMSTNFTADLTPSDRGEIFHVGREKNIPVHPLFGIPVTAATMQQILTVCQESIESRRRLMIGVINAAKVVAMKRDPVLNHSVMNSDLILADGMSVVLASRILRRPLPERVPGIDLFENLLQLGDEKRYSVYFLGATQDVLDEVLRQVRKRYPNLQIAGSHNGYFSDDGSQAIAEKVQQARPDMLFVAMTSPKKENFLANWGEMMDVKVCHGVGGSFDVMAGKVKRAPKRWQKYGFEWLYRVIQEPRRMWKRYLVTNTLFMYICVSEVFRKRTCFSRKNAGMVFKGTQK
jgi:N-acetylglucosaminyldiphosphoundecaprenol N-acetyl-beta-D-mannosaminyltransferase